MRLTRREALFVVVLKKRSLDRSTASRASKEGKINARRKESGIKEIKNVAEIGMEEESVRKQ